MKTAPVLALFAAATALAQAPASPDRGDYDILIRHGRLVDGAGNPAFTGDLAIRNGRIAAMGPLEGRRAKRVIDAANLVVAPGFIDIHNHSDYTLLADGDAQSMIRQGVTTMILGEGGSAAPLGGKQERKSRNGGWTDFNGYFARLLSQGIATNIGTYVGSSQIWTYVHGERAGPVSPAEVEEMQSSCARRWNRARSASRVL